MNSSGLDPSLPGPSDVVHHQVNPVVSFNDTVFVDGKSESCCLYPPHTTITPL